MQRVWLIGGTSESVKIAQLLTEHQITTTITVTTPAAVELYPESVWLKIIVGQIAPEQINFFFTARANKSNNRC